MSGRKRGLLHLDPAMRRFFSYVRPYGWWVAGATFFGLLITLPGQPGPRVTDQVIVNAEDELGGVL